MTDRSASGPSVTVRHEPVQARAAHRIEALLDAAAAVVVEHGIEHLTTALVAERAGASIGTVYRYFPDRVAVLVALAERNLERMQQAVERELRGPHETWPEAMEAVVGATIVGDGDELLLIRASGKVIRSNVDEVRATGRTTMGVQFAERSDKDLVIQIARNVEEEVEDAVAETDATAASTASATTDVEPEGAIVDATDDAAAPADPTEENDE